MTEPDASCSAGRGQQRPGELIVSAWVEVEAASRGRGAVGLVVLAVVLVALFAVSFAIGLMPTFAFLALAACAAAGAVWAGRGRTRAESRTVRLSCDGQWLWADVPAIRLAGTGWLDEHDATLVRDVTQTVMAAGKVRIESRVLWRSWTDGSAVVQSAPPAAGAIVFTVSPADGPRVASFLQSFGVFVTG